MDTGEAKIDFATRLSPAAHADSGDLGRLDGPDRQHRNGISCTRRGIVARPARWQSGGAERGHGSRHRRNSIFHRRAAAAGAERATQLGSLFGRSSGGWRFRSYRFREERRGRGSRRRALLALREMAAGQADSGGFATGGYRLRLRIAPRVGAAASRGCPDRRCLFAAGRHLRRLPVRLREAGYRLRLSDPVGRGVPAEGAHSGRPRSIDGQLSAAAECFYAGGLSLLLIQAGAAAAAVCPAPDGGERLLASGPMGGGGYRRAGVALWIGGFGPLDTLGFQVKAFVRGVPHFRGIDRGGLLRGIHPVRASRQAMEGNPREGGRRNWRGAWGRLTL